VTASLDTKPYVEHHPTFGYRYIPNTEMVLDKPGGGRYRIRINGQGIRSDREFTAAKRPGAYRIVVLGDSMAAGQFLPNESRFGELLERRCPSLEVINLALEGSGTDQQVLLYEHLGLTFEHDAVVLLPFLQNIRRNMVEAREAVDPRTRMMTLRPKPRFELRDGELVLRNVPVPTSFEHSSGAELPRSAWKTRVARLPGAAIWRRVIQSAVPWEPFPEYGRDDTREWQLMRALILRLKMLAGPRPVAVVPTFYANYIRFRMARNYWSRFASLGDTPGLHPVDVLPDFQRGSTEEALSCFQEPYDMHFSALGHIVLADAVAAAFTRLRLWPEPIARCCSR
jgi:hypothetical protein